MDYASYHSAILQQSKETELNIALIVDTSCTNLDIIELSTKLKLLRKTAFCYQMDVKIYEINGIIQFLLAGKVSLVVLLQPWFISLDLLEKMKYYGLTNMAFIAIELNRSHLRHLQFKDIFLKVFNLRSIELKRMISHSKSIHEREIG